MENSIKDLSKGLENKDFAREFALELFKANPSNFFNLLNVMNGISMMPPFLLENAVDKFFCFNLNDGRKFYCTIYTPDNMVNCYWYTGFYNTQGSNIVSNILDYDSLIEHCFEWKEITKDVFFTRLKVFCNKQEY